MAVTARARQALPPEGSEAVARLGLDQPAGWWPTTPRLKSIEAAGFGHLQVRMPPRSVLADGDLRAAHAAALRDSLALTGLHLILHAPDDLLAGSDEHDRQFHGALSYAALAGSDLIVYHGARVPLASRAVRRRLADELCSLRPLVRRARSLGIRLAIENLAPVYPGEEFVSHDPSVVHELSRRLESDHVGICLDVGHAHIAAGVTGCSLLELVEPVLDRVILFHVHDNFGFVPNGARPGGIEPLKLDLHLPPGAGSVPWEALAPVLGAHPAPLQLEIQPPGRPDPATLAVVTRELLRMGSR